MSINTPSKWLTVCLHYNEPWEEFLVKAVKPYVDVVMQTGISEHFYFERSWKQGPHIRLHIKGSPFVICKMLKPNLEEHFEQYFETRPSFIIEPKYPEIFPEDHKWLPNNSIQYLPLNHITTHFSKPYELALCKKQFQVSSKLVLQTLKEKAGTWTYNDLINTAVKMHLGFATGIGMSQAEAAGFFGVLFEQWKTQLLKRESSYSRSHGPTVLHSFQKIFEHQKRELVPYHAALWEVFKSYNQIGDEDFSEWVHTNAKLGLELNMAIEDGLFEKRRLAIARGSFSDNRQAILWNIFASLVAALNNRLGIHNKTEGFLLFLLSQSLDTLKVRSKSLERTAV
jgi:lantibiotic biosynthesis dehydratase-like protein